jgi:tRNA-binding protein
MPSPTRGIAEPKQKITFGKFENVDMRIGRVLAAPLAESSRFPSRVIQIDLGPLGTVQSVGQYALVAEEELIGKNVVVCVNLGSREMGSYISDALMLGAPHPDNPDGQSQATPLWADERVAPGHAVY